MTRRPAAILWAAMALGLTTTVSHALPSYQQVRQAYTPSDLSLLLLNPFKQFHPGITP